MTKKGRKKRKKDVFAFFFVNVYECEQKFIFTDENIDKVKTSEDGEIINDCFLLNEYKRLFWREK